MTLITNIKCANLSINYDTSSNKVSTIILNGEALRPQVRTLLNQHPKDQGHPFTTKVRYFFDKQIETICKEVFEAVKEIKTKYKNDVLAAYVASTLFEAFAAYWRQELLEHGLLKTGVSFWQEVISLTLDWESKNKPITIHKGTPFFFLAFNCLENGDKDNGFTYLYNALEDDKKLPDLNYPQDAPAYLTATMSDKPRNFMYSLVRDQRLLLSNFLIKHKSEFSELKLIDFDKKFLQNVDLADVVYFFVYNFHTIFDQDRNTNQIILQNEFSRLKTLDLFFNIGLIIDQVLSHAASQADVTCTGMKDAVVWWVDNNLGVNQTTFNSLIGTSNLNINSQTLDQVLPTLLSNISNPSSSIPKEVFAMLVAYKIRNHGAHNLNQQQILTSRYDEILSRLFNALFLAVQIL